jgi:hypothetical protein
MYTTLELGVINIHAAIHCTRPPTLELSDSLQQLYTVAVIVLVISLCYNFIVYLIIANKT